jgi:sugar lactone lactonase YvrE
MANFRRFVAVLIGFVVLVPLLGHLPGAAAEGPNLERVAGTTGEGTATNVGQRPQGIAVHGTTLYISDGNGTNVVRALDLTTGHERIVAGSVAGARRDNVPGTTTTLANPAGMATDVAGNLYIAENGQVRKLDTDGIISTVAGAFIHQGAPLRDGGPATEAQISPEDVAVDAAGNLYIADYFNHRIRKVDTAGIISTVAGNGSAGFSGDGGPATAAQIGRPAGVAVDSQGNLYIADNENYRVRKVDGAGTITTFAGTGTKGTSGDGGPASAARLADPRDIALDRDGNVYIADTYGYRMRKVDTSGMISTFAGNGQYGNGGDGGPATAAQVLAFDVTFDGAGNLYFADSWLDKVRRIDSQGVVTTVAGNGFTHFRGDGGPALDAQVHGIQRLAIDPVSGRLAFADSGSRRVRTIDTAGVVSTIYIGPSFDFWLFSGLAYDPSGNLYVGESGRIRRIDRNGTVTVVAGTGESGFSGDGGLATDAKINLASSLTFDSAGNLYFNDMHNERIRKISTLGIISTVAGSGIEGFSGDGGPATAAGIWPWYGADVIVDDVGNLYLADSYNDRVRKVDPSGTITSVGAGEVDFPTGMALDGAGNLFVASASDHKVRRMTPGGVWSTVAGNGSYGFGGEGGPATSAELALIGFGMGGDVAVDQDGTLFIGGWQRIWKVDGVAEPVTFPDQAPPATSTTTTPSSTSITTPTTTPTSVTGGVVRDIAEFACPPGSVDGRDFSDVASGSAHAPAITCAEWYGIVEGFADGTFRPGREVTRGQSATFVANLLDASGLERPLNQPGSFSDTPGDTHEDNIEWLVGLGIVGGFTDGSFGPGLPVTRGQMATILANIYEEITGNALAEGDTSFPDDGGAHRSSIRRIAEAGLTGGKANGGFDPAGRTPRDQMASFVMRLTDVLVELGEVQPPAA